MEIEELAKTHPVYDDHITDWTFWGLAYTGGTPFINYALQRHPRESEQNWRARQEEGICFNYASIIIDLFNFYLTEKPALRDYGALFEDPLWQMFLKDANLYQDNFDVFLNEAQKLAAIYGAVGVLVDKPAGGNLLKKDDLRAGIYPYCAKFTLPNILDWEHERDPATNRPTLTYLKLLDFDDRYLLWWPDKWEIWIAPEEEGITSRGVRVHKHVDISSYKPQPGNRKFAGYTGRTVSALNSTIEPVLLAEGENPLGEIPFIWFQNIKNIMDPYIGVSDIKEIARITSSLTRNISYGEEVIKYAGFPQARRPMAREGEEISNEVGVTAILEFDPSLGEAGKPDWLPAEVQEPIEAILAWIDRKINESFQLAHLSGIHAHEKSGQVRSGVALRYEYQQLSLVLGKKSENLTEAELGIICYWLKWQNLEKLHDDIDIVRTREFSIDDLSQSLENAIMANKLIPEPKFKRELMKQVAKRLLPDLPDDRLMAVQHAIEALSDETVLETDEERQARLKDIRQVTHAETQTGERIISHAKK